MGAFERNRKKEFFFETNEIFGKYLDAFIENGYCEPLAPWLVFYFKYLNGPKN